MFEKILENKKIKFMIWDFKLLRKRLTDVEFSKLLYVYGTESFALIVFILMYFTTRDVISANTKEIVIFLSNYTFWANVPQEFYCAVIVAFILVLYYVGMNIIKTTIMLNFDAILLGALLFLFIEYDGGLAQIMILKKIPLNMCLMGAEMLIFFVYVYAFLRNNLKILKRKEVSFSSEGYIVDTPKMFFMNLGWDSYAKNICDKIKKTVVEKNSRTTQNSLCIGISGKWGDGKTTFLRMMKSNFSSENIIDFSPWSCSSIKNLQSAFFKSLRQVFSWDEQDLVSDIRKYASLIMSASKNKHINVLGKIMQQEQYEKNLKKHISNRLKLRKNPIIVFVDDLDRTTADEILEIFKLIRNTANFENVIYILAYDKEYIQSQLAKKGIGKDCEFVEKMVSLELNLPMYEKDALPKLFFYEIQIMIKDQNAVKVLWEEIRQCPLFYEVIKNFRSVNRFANLFVTRYSSLASVEGYDLADLFWVTLIEYDDFRIYCELKAQSSSVIEKSKDFFVLKKDLDEKYSKYKSCLMRLFDDRKGCNNSKTRRLRLVESFDMYFSGRLMNNQVPKDELIDTINEKYPISDVVNKYLNPQYEYSLSCIVSQIEINALNLKQKKNYFDVMIEICRGKSSARLKRWTSIYETKIKEVKENKTEVFEYIYYSIKKAINSYGESWFFADLLTKIHGHETYYDYDWVEPEWFNNKTKLNNENIESLLTENIEKLLSQSPSLINLAKDEGFFYQILKSSCYSYTHPEMDDYDTIQLVQENLWNYVKKRPQEELKALYDWMNEKPDLPEELGEYYQDERIACEHRNEERIKNTIGENNYAELKKTLVK